MDQTDITLSVTGTDSLVQNLYSLFLENMWEMSCMHPKVEPNTQIVDIGLDDGHGVDGVYFSTLPMPSKGSLYLCWYSFFLDLCRCPFLQ